MVGNFLLVLGVYKNVRGIVLALVLNLLKFEQVEILTLCKAIFTHSRVPER